MPAWDANGNPIPSAAPTAWDANGNPIGATPSPSTDTVSAAPPKTTKDILADFETDLRAGGRRTAVGRLLGQLQGRGDAGYTGLNSGVSPGVANFMGSPELGVTHAIQGVQQIPSHPIAGSLQLGKGLLQAATIPSMVMAGPEAKILTEAIPSAEYGGKLFNELNTTLANTPVPLKNALQPLQRAVEIGGRGSTLPKSVSDLLTRSESPLGTSMSFPEARDYQGALSDLSASDKLAMNGRMRGAVAQLNKGLYGDIRAAASTSPDVNGLGNGGDVFDSAMKNYRQASQLKQAAKTVGKYAIGAGGLGTLYEVLKAAQK